MTLEADAAQVAASAVPRGIRNNNPGNLRWGDPWQGLIPVAERTDPSFCQFISAHWGLRALGKVLVNYVRNDFTKPTVEEIIDRYAPPSENDTAAYIADVCKHLGVEQDTPLDLEAGGELAALIQCICMHENGSALPYGPLDYSTAAVAARC